MHDVTMILLFQVNSVSLSLLSAFTHAQNALLQI